jgi:hypothetical protein
LREQPHEGSAKEERKAGLWGRWQKDLVLRAQWQFAIQGWGKGDKGCRGEHQSQARLFPSPWKKVAGPWVFLKFQHPHPVISVPAGNGESHDTEFSFIFQVILR